MTNPAPKRRWFRFSLRGLFVLVTILCVWLGYELNWRHQRKQFLEQAHVFHEFEEYYPFDDTTPPRTVDAPWGLRILGERGVACVNVHFDSDNPRRPTSEEAAQGLIAERLFPEAKVGVYANPLLRRSPSYRPPRPSVP